MNDQILDGCKYVELVPKGSFCDLLKNTSCSLVLNHFFGAKKYLDMKKIRQTPLESAPFRMKVPLSPREVLSFLGHSPFSNINVVVNLNLFLVIFSLFWGIQTPNRFKRFDSKSLWGPNICIFRLGEVEYTSFLHFFQLFWIEVFV